MTKYIVSILFALALAFTGGYSVAAIKVRQEYKETANALEEATAGGVFLNDSRLLIFLTEHLNERGRLAEDPKLVAMLRVGLEGILDLDAAYQQMVDEGRDVPLMLEEIRTEAAAALRVLKSHPASKEAE